MTVAIHPSEARPRAADAPAPRRPHKPLRKALLAGAGLLALAGFAAASSHLFSDLADPRIKPRTSSAAASWPELKDGIPALAETGAVHAAVLNLPRPAPAEPAQAQAATAAPEAPVPATPVVAAAPAPETAPARETRRTPSIENAATLAVPAKPVALVAPRPAPAIAPARAETVKAKPAQPGRFVSLGPDGAKPEAVPPKPETVAAKPEAVTQKPKPVASKAETPPKASAKALPKASAVKQVADAQPAPAPEPAAAAPEEPEVMGVKIPGGRQLRDGLQAVGSLFGGD